jgi:hypothetical protein
MGVLLQARLLGISQCCSTKPFLKNSKSIVSTERRADSGSETDCQRQTVKSISKSSMVSWIKHQEFQLLEGQVVNMTEAEKEK